jgi:hypothetical protein
MYIVAGADHARDLLVEEHREPRRLHARLVDVGGVVQADRQELPRPGGRQQAHVGQRVLRRLAGERLQGLDPHPGDRGGLGGQPGIDGAEVADGAVLDHAKRRAVAGVEAAEPHADASGISTGTWSGA